MGRGLGPGGYGRFRGLASLWARRLWSDFTQITKTRPITKRIDGRWEAPKSARTDDTILKGKEMQSDIDAEGSDGFIHPEICIRQPNKDAGYDITTCAHVRALDLLFGSAREIPTDPDTNNTCTTWAWGFITFIGDHASCPLIPSYSIMKICIYVQQDPVSSVTLIFLEQLKREVKKDFSGGMRVSILCHLRVEDVFSRDNGDNERPTKFQLSWAVLLLKGI